jgi:hypothetical protein
MAEPTPSNQTTDESEGEMRFGFGFRPFFDQSITYDGNRLYYREWNLVSSPQFFRIIAEEGPKENKSLEPDLIEAPPVNRKSDLDPGGRLPIPRIIQPID